MRQRKMDSVDQMIIMEIWTYLSIFIWWRRLVKYALHFSTGCCELQRICNKTNQGALRTSKVENSLRQSRTKFLQELSDCEDVNLEEAADTVLQVKKIDKEKEPVFFTAIYICVGQICGYTKLCHDVEECRRESYSSENREHEKKLLQLWDLMMPGTPLEQRITKQWGDLGFQGDDPQTDFRGMGILGLDNLLYFARKHPQAARKVLSHSHHPHSGYPFAVVGINITSLTYQLLKTGALRNHFYNSKQGSPSIADFTQVYCYLLYEFNGFWINEKPENIMKFNEVKDKFEQEIRKLLRSTDAHLELKYRTEDDTLSVASVESLERETVL